MEQHQKSTYSDVRDLEKSSGWEATTESVQNEQKMVTISTTITAYLHEIINKKLFTE